MGGTIVYSIKLVVGSKPRRYQVFFGSVPFSRPMNINEAKQYLDLMQGNIDCINTGWKSAKASTPNS